MSTIGPVAGESNNGSALAPQGINQPAPTGAPAPGAKVVDPVTGKPQGPQFTRAPGDTVQDLQKKRLEDRKSRVAAVLAESAPAEQETVAEGTAEGEGVERTVADDALPNLEVAVEADVEVQEGDAAAKDATKVSTDEQARLARVTAAAAKAKASAAAYKRAVAENAKNQALLQQTQQRTRALEQEVQRARAIEQRFRADPLKALEESGVTPEAIAERVMRAGTPEEKLQILQQQVESERKARLAMEQSIKAEKEAAARETHVRQVEDTFIKRASDVERYPNLAGQPRDALIALGVKVAQQTKSKYLRETGVEPTITDQQILSHLNKIYGKSKAPAAETPASTAKAATAAKAAPSKAKTPVAAKASPEAKQPRTITSAQSAGAFSRPPNWETLSRNQRVKILQERLLK